MPIDKLPFLQRARLVGEIAQQGGIELSEQARVIAVKDPRARAALSNYEEILKNLQERVVIAREIGEVYPWISAEDMLINYSNEVVSYNLKEGGVGMVVIHSKGEDAEAYIVKYLPKNLDMKWEVFRMHEEGYKENLYESKWTHKMALQEAIYRGMDSRLGLFNTDQEFISEMDFYSPEAITVICAAYINIPNLMINSGDGTFRERTPLLSNMFSDLPPLAVIKEQ